MALSDAKIRGLKPQPKSFKVSDTNGLYLFVTPAGGKSWRMNFMLDRKQKTATFGRYPQVSLADARIKVAEARALLAKGIDPTAEQQAQPTPAEASSAPTFKATADLWLAANQDRLSQSYFARVRSRIEHDIYPFIGTKHLDQIRPKDVLDVVRRIESRGALEIARRVLKTIEDVFGWAIADETNGVQVNPARDLGKALAPPPAVKNMAAIPYADMPRFYRQLDDYPGDVATLSAIRFLILNWSRTGEARFAEWSEIEDLGGAEPMWRIPAARMKMREAHLVPLSRQAADVLKLMSMISGKGRLIFPTRAGKDKALSENAMLYALYAMGHRGTATVHGFRASASTWANENGHEPDVVERCLAHVDGSVRGIYNRALYLPQRRSLLQAWADYVSPPGVFSDLL